jgi:hypothetical protein
MENMVITKEKQIKTVYNGYKHIVILGAGASIASCIDIPEKNSLSLPSMDNCLSILGIENKYSEIIDTVQSKNLEVVFSYLYYNQPNSILLKELETYLFNYFDKLILPDVPTIYDYLILSLRKKDLIATFNWDPFLWQAYERNLRFTNNLPHLAFLHGNVAIGTCENDKTFGPKDKVCLNCQSIFEPIKLLYPISKKNYNSSPYINAQWDLLSQSLINPARVTVFGYSAPKSDVEAISIMKKVYSKSKIKEFTQFEIIDVANEDKLTESWDNFIFSHHYDIRKSFFDSSIAMFPRRSGEVFHENILGAKFYEENFPPKFQSFQQMWGWYSPFVEYENTQGSS